VDLDALVVVLGQAAQAAVNPDGIRPVRM